MHKGRLCTLQKKEMLSVTPETKLETQKDEYCRITHGELEKVKLTGAESTKVVTRDWKGKDWEEFS